eukprot:scaffold8293_cov123-Isochrysis_galbana.AAC.2
MVTPYILVADSSRAARFTFGERYEQSILMEVPTAPSMAQPKLSPYPMLLGRRLDGADRPAEGGQRAVAHERVCRLRLLAAELWQVGQPVRRRFVVVVDSPRQPLQARLPHAQEGLAQVAVGLPAIVGDGRVHHAGGRVGKRQDLLAQTLEHLLVLIDDAEAEDALDHLARHHRVDGVSPLEVLGHQVVARLTKANLQERRNLDKRGVQRVRLVLHLGHRLQLERRVGRQPRDRVDHPLYRPDHHRLGVAREHERDAAEDQADQ